jgi:hypothetical protein
MKSTPCKKRTRLPGDARKVAEVATTGSSAPIPGAMLCAAAGALATAVAAKLLHSILPKKPRVVRGIL